MIAVIADDFTGAAEIGGVGIRNGFKVIIETRVPKNIATDILIIATDTRSLDLRRSEALIKKITEELLALQPEFIYKKFDSVMRGNVGEELLVQLKVSNKKRALLVPANPTLKRTIKNGIYYYNGIPLKESGFFKGEVNKSTSSEVLDLIGERSRPYTRIISTGTSLPGQGLMIGNTLNAEDLALWVKKVDSDTIPAGGSGFFDAILRHLTSIKTAKPNLPVFGEKTVFVCGSAFLPSRKVVRNARQSGQKVIYIPKELFHNFNHKGDLITQWADEIVNGVRHVGKVIVAVDEIDFGKIENLPQRIREGLAKVIEKVMDKVKIDELVIEGGATAYAIINKLNYKRFRPTHELAPGVTRMKVEENSDLFLTMKPGSYEWPPSIWQY